MRLLTFLIFAYGTLILVSLSALASEKSETTLLAGGCFWCIESDFEKLDGVIDVQSGYAGGDRPEPTYQTYNKLSDGYKTPHIEVIQVTYDSDKLSYKDVLEYHIRHIDPTDGNGQFCDRGPGYRPAIFVKDDGERKIANQVNTETAEIIGQDVNVDILQDAQFYPAEEYHQDYAQKSPTRYKFYRWKCGRDQRVNDVWGKENTDHLTLNE